MRTGTEVVNPCIQILDTVDPKVPLKEIQKEKKIADNNIANNHMISMSLNTSQSNLTEISNSADTLHVRN